MVALDLIPESAQPFPRLPTVPAWEELAPEVQAMEAREMAVYAAMVDSLDHHIGRILDYLRQIGEYDNTLVLFFSDNGANGLEMRSYPGQTDEYVSSFDNSVENIGREDSFTAQGPAWAQVSMVPFRLFKGIVKLSRIGLTDPQHPGSRKDSSPSSRGSVSRVFVNLTVPPEGIGYNDSWRRLRCFLLILGVELRCVSS